MTKITKTQAPEDFALEILDNLMEGEKELTVFQLLQAAQAYATAGVAQATRESAGNLDSLERDNDEALKTYTDETEGRARRLGGELPVIEFVPNEGIPSSSYALVSNGTETYWVHKNATQEEIESGIALIQFFSNTEDADAVEGELEHVDVSSLDIEDAYEEFKRDQAERKVTTTGSKVVFKEDIYEKEPTKVLPQTLREKIEAEIALRKVPNTEDVLGTLAVVTPDTDIIGGDPTTMDDAADRMTSEGAPVADEEVETHE